MQRILGLLLFLQIPLAACSQACWQEVIHIESSPSQDLLADAYPLLLQQYAESYCVDEVIKDRILADAEWTRNIIDDRHQLSRVLAWANMNVVTADGKSQRVDAFRSDDPEILSATRDEYMRRIGEGAAFETNGEYTVITGPRTTIVEEGHESIHYWQSVHLRWSNGWLFYGVSEVSMNIPDNERIFELLAPMEGSSWYSVSAPGEVSELARNAMLASYLGGLRTARQRRDAESLADYTKRAAPLELWESYTSARFFDTELLTGRRSTPKIDEPILYTWELTASKGTELAEAIGQLRLRTPKPINKDSAAGLSVAARVPESIRKQCAALLQTSEAESGLDLIRNALASAIASGELNTTLEVQLDADEDVSWQLSVQPVLNKDVPQVSADSTVQLPFDLAYHNISLGPGLIDAVAGDDGEFLFSSAAPSTPETATSSETENPDEMRALRSTVLMARLNFRKFAQCEPDSAGGRIYRAMELAYLRDLYSVTVFVGGSNSAGAERPTEFPDNDVRDALRRKVVGGSDEDWTAAVRIDVFPRERRLTINATVGPRLYGFRQVAQWYAWSIVSEAFKAARDNLFGQ